MDGDTVPCTIDGQAMVSDGEYSIAFISFHWLFLLSYFFRVYIVRQSIPPHGAIGIGMLPYAKSLLSQYISIYAPVSRCQTLPGSKCYPQAGQDWSFPTVLNMTMTAICP